MAQRTPKQRKGKGRAELDLFETKKKRMGGKKKVKKKKGGEKKKKKVYSK